MNDFIILINDYDENHQIKDKIIDKLKSISDEFQLSPDEKINILKKLIKIKDFEQYVLETVWKIRDSVSHVKGFDLEDIVEFLFILSQSSEFSPHERIISTVCLYNHGYIDKCYKCFRYIASDESIDYKNRVEAAKFLFSSDDEENQEFAQTIIIDIIDSPEEILSSEKRYKIITEFITNSGIRTFLNKSKLRIPYCEEFVYGIQIIFFYNQKNGIREKILSGQHLLQMEHTPQLEKTQIENYLLELSLDRSYEENVRADAADVVLRLSKNNDQRLKAREIIGKIGFEKNKSSTNLIDKAETLYSNSQNVHNFSDQIDQIVENLIKENIHLSNVKFKNIHDIVSNYAKTHIENREHRYKILKSLNRISIDTATFTRFNSTLAEIFTLVWVRVENNFSDVIKEEIKNRLLEELIDMGDTCSSGHISRIINALCVYDESISLKISFSQQLISNFIGRLNARIKNHPDEDIKYSLTVVHTDLVEEKDKEIYISFLRENVPILEKELYDEFVNHEHMDSKEFYESFQEIVKKVQI